MTARPQRRLSVFAAQRKVRSCFPAEHRSLPFCAPCRSSIAARVAPSGSAIRVAMKTLCHAEWRSQFGQSWVVACARNTEQRASGKRTEVTSLALGTYRAVGNIYRTSPPAKEMALLRAGAPMHFQETSITWRIMPQLALNYKNDFLEHLWSLRQWRLAYCPKQ